MNSKVKVAGWILLKLSSSMALLYLATRHVDLHSLGEDIQGLNLAWLSAALFQTFLIPSLGGSRWSLVLSSLGAPFGLLRASKLFWISMVFNQVLPSVSGGDAVRVVLGYRAGLPLDKSIHSVVLERVAVLFALIALAEFMQLVLWHTASQVTGVRILPALFLVALGGVFALVFADRLTSRLPSWLPVAFVTRLSIDSKTAFFSASGVKLVFLCLITHVNFALASVWLGKAFGMNMSLQEYLYFVSIVTLVTTLPISIGGWGVREGTWVILLGSVGISAHTAVAFSVLSGTTVLLVSLSGIPLFWSANLFRLKSSPMNELIKLSGNNGRVVST